MASQLPWISADTVPAAFAANVARGGALAAAPLPSLLTALVGRERELSNLREYLLREELRLLTLTGPGGIGKTRLAIEVARGLAPDFADGAAFVPLAAVGAPEQVAPAVFHTLAGKVNGLDYSLDRLHRLVGDRSLLLVIDNFEHVVSAAPLVTGLLSAAPGLRILVTSRVPLRLSGEQEFLVPPLSIGDRAIVHAEEIAPPADAVRLFILRAEAAATGFAAAPEALPDIAEICRRLDGLPLAIELAAARVTHLTPRALLSRIDGSRVGRLQLLTGGPQDLPRRQQTMRATIAWSYDLLSSNERLVFQQLGVFAGGFSLAAASAVCGVDEATLLECISSLVARNLVRYDGDADGDPRYTMLETIHEFAREQLAASESDTATRQRHAAWALDSVEAAAPRLRGPDAAIWLEHVDRDYPNLRAALSWLAAGGDAAMLVRLGSGLLPYWDERAHFAEGRHWLETALAIASDLPAPDRLRLVSDAGSMAWRQTRFAEAIAHHEKALALARSLGNREAEAFALNNIGVQVKELGRFDEALARYEESLAVARAANVSLVEVMALHNLAQLQRVQYQSAAALQSTEMAIAIARDHGLAWLETALMVGLGLVAADLGDTERARASLHDGLSQALAKGNRAHSVDGIESFARLAEVTGQFHQASRLFGAAASLREQFDFPCSPAELAYFEPMRARLVAALGTLSFASAWAEGRAMTFDDAVAEALAVPVTPAVSARAAASPNPAPFGLTAREVEVLNLLASGLSNRRIGERLFISQSTAARHVANIYNKLGVDSRAAVTAFAIEHHLVTAPR